MAGSLSQDLSLWLKTPGPKTYGDLEKHFGHQTLLLLLVILMVPSALPLPTGGITHGFEIVVMLLSLRMSFGKAGVWLPANLRTRQVSSSLTAKALPKIINLISKLESLSRPRFSLLVTKHWFVRLAGLLIFGLTLAAFLAPPFTGLDTLPSLGVVLVAISLMFEDIAILIAGVVVGLFGIGLEVALGSLAWHFIH